MKVAVSVPDPIFEAAERLAKQHSVPRSQIFAEALAAYIKAHDSEAITSQLNEVYAHESAGVEPGLAQAQLQSISHESW